MENYNIKFSYSINFTIKTKMTADKAYKCITL